MVIFTNQESPSVVISESLSSLSFLPALICVLTQALETAFVAVTLVERKRACRLLPLSTIPVEDLLLTRAIHIELVVLG